MDQTRLYLPSILAMVLLVFQAGTLICQDSTCDLNDFKALVGFSSCLNSMISGWNISSSDCCTWNGVACDNSSTSGGRVIGLELGSQRLGGNVCKSLAGLDQLRILNLSHNNFNFYFPAEFFYFQSLEVLDLSNNYFQGPVLEGSYLPALRYIDISRNRFGGSPDASLCKTSPYIQVLNLANNNFTGEVSTSFQSFTTLQQLLLNGNHLSGSFPASLLQLQDLRVLQLQEDSFSGPLYDGIGNLSNLVHLDISSNNFYGSLPDVFGRLQKLENFSAGSNKFSGQMPESLVNSPSLVKLDLQYNSLTAINLNCSAMISLVSLDLGRNNFQGPIPESISSCKRLSILSLGGNKLSGEVPKSFKNLQALTFISFSNSSLSNISAALEILQHCKNLTVLVLAKNFRAEQIPNKVKFQFRNLKVLAIPNCPLRGSVPVWLSGCKRLQLLDLSWNHLEGYIPNWLGNFSYLFYIDLSNNSFTGQIPRNLTKLRGLSDKNMLFEVLDLKIPLYRTPGHCLRYNKLGSFPPTLDLSYNKLTGPIWPSFGNLKRLIVLSLEQNRLSASIPDSLSEMTNIETLDLSHNDLSGEIPVSLVKLSFLSKFSVTYNQLQRNIPTGGQFMTFTYSSFEGNNGLCSEAFGVPCQPAESPAQSPLDSPREKITIWGLPFGLGAATSFLLTVAFCFMSGWAFPEGKRRKTRVN